MKITEYRGLFHIHSDFSYDGVVPLVQIASRAQEEGLSFVLPTEHAADVESRGVFERLVRACEECSTGRLIVLPGIEYDCHPWLHLLAVGISEPIQPRDARTIARMTHAGGGLVIAAHYDFRRTTDVQDILELIDGVEIWNKKYDGAWGFLPTKGREFNRVRGVHPRLSMYCGLDFHSWSDWANLCLTVYLESLDREQLVSALRKGEFAISNGRVTLKAKRYWLSTGAEVDMWAVAGLGCLVNRGKRVAKTIVDTVGLHVPNGLRDQLRRFP